MTVFYFQREHVLEPSDIVWSLESYCVIDAVCCYGNIWTTFSWLFYISNNIL